MSRSHISNQSLTDQGLTGQGLTGQGFIKRHAVVTGAGARVGRAIAIELAHSGFEVALHFNQNQEGALETLHLIQESGGTGWITQADLSQPEGALSLSRSVNERWDRVDLLVNNASLFEPTPFEEISLRSWEKMLMVNLTAPFLLSQALLPALKRVGELSERGDQRETDQPLNDQRKRGGLIVHLCDIGAERPLLGYTHYSVSKAGLVMLVKSMAIELAPAVRCVGINPGQVAWPPFFPAETRQKLEKRIPMSRSGSPEDIARLIRFLVFEGTYINGELIAVDGGLSCRY